MPDSAAQTVERAIVDGECLRLVLSQPQPGSRLIKATLQPVVVRREPCLQLALQTAKQVTHENLSPAIAAKRIRQLMGEIFQQGKLSTPSADVALHRRPDGSWKQKIVPHAGISPAPPASEAGHNRRKSHLIPDHTPCSFLSEIGVMTPEGKVRTALYHKFRQINRYLELVEDIIPALPTNRPLRVVDFGCGKSYLTFALHHLLTEVHGKTVHIVGLDSKADVVQHCAEIAQRLGCQGLEFREGDLADYSPAEAVDLSVSLHACDTATDAALAQAIGWGCRVILAVPCCQHELSPQLRSDTLQPLTRHGILHERFSALATDALRAQLLEICGYATQVVEFIDLEHTPKNVLLRAVRRQQPDSHRSQRIAEYHRCRQFLGLGNWSLESALTPHLPQDFFAMKLPAASQE